jgi:hypothetical protein
MAGKRKKRKSRRVKRQTYVLLKKSEKAQIREFSKFAPALNAYRGVDRITSAQYGAFKKIKTKLRHTENLRPITELQAKHAPKGTVVGGGIRAIRLRNTSPKDAGTRVKTVTKEGVVITTNGRDWEYHPVAATPQEIQEVLIETGRELFNRSKNPPWQLHLWTAKGRANFGVTSFEKWAQYIMGAFNKYAETQDFVKGVAALVRDGKNGYHKERKRKSKPWVEPDSDENGEE